MAEIGSELVFYQSEFGTRHEAVPEIGEAGIKPPPVFKENVDDSFGRVANFEKDEEVEIPILAVQPKTLKIPQTGDGQKRKRIKTLAGRTYLLLVRQFKAMQVQASSQSKFSTSKPSPKPSSKSYHLASQSI